MSIEHISDITSPDITTTIFSSNTTTMAIGATTNGRIFSSIKEYISPSTLIALTAVGISIVCYLKTSTLEKKNDSLQSELTDTQKNLNKSQEQLTESQKKYDETKKKNKSNKRELKNITNNFNILQVQYTQSMEYKLEKEIWQKQCIEARETLAHEIGRNESLQQQILSNKDQIAQMPQSVLSPQDRVQLNLIIDELQTAKQEAFGLQNELSTFRDKLVEIQTSSLTNSPQAPTQILFLADKELQNRNETIKTQQVEIGNLKNKIDALDKKLQDNEILKQKIATAFRNYRDLTKQSQQQTEEFNNKNQELIQVNEELKQDIQAFTATIKTFAAENSTLLNENRRLAEELKALHDKMENFLNDMETDESDNSDGFNDFEKNTKIDNSEENKDSVITKSDGQSDHSYSLNSKNSLSQSLYRLSDASNKYNISIDD